MKRISLNKVMAKLAVEQKVDLAQHKVELKDIVGEIQAMYKESGNLKTDLAAAVGKIDTGATASVRIVDKYIQSLEQLRNKMEYAMEGFAEVGIPFPNELGRIEQNLQRDLASANHKKPILKQFLKGVKMLYK